VLVLTVCHRLLPTVQRLTAAAVVAAVAADVDAALKGLTELLLVAVGDVAHRA
jgi:hypothetical protein